MESSSARPDYRGKVRDLYFVDESRMIMVASDRISAFDVVFAQPVPDKGRILTSISAMWFRALRDSGLQKKYNFRDHLLSDRVADFPPPFCNEPGFAGRSLLTRRTGRIDFECVVRAYLAGSAWKEYSASGQVCGIQLPAGLQLGSPLPELIFTPATKAPLGEHDQNISFEQMQTAIGAPLAERLRTVSLAIFRFAAERMHSQGILLCDTKFEFGRMGDELYLIDEALTPDSSRYWDAGGYRVGESPPGFDKQFVRDYLESIGWDKRPPPPELPAEVIERTVRLYRDIEERIARGLGLAAPLSD